MVVKRNLRVFGTLRFSLTESRGVGVFEFATRGRRRCSKMRDGGGIASEAYGEPAIAFSAGDWRNGDLPAKQTIWPMVCSDDGRVEVV